MFIKLISVLISVMFLCTSVGAEQKIGDPSAGERVFKKCKSCHMVGDGAKNRSGPSLNGVFGSKIGSVDKFKYSKAFRDYSEKNIIWDSETLDLLLTKPRDYIPKTKMSFAGLKKAQDRADVIDFALQIYLEIIKILKVQEIKSTKWGVSDSIAVKTFHELYSKKISISRN